MHVSRVTPGRSVSDYVAAVLGQVRSRNPAEPEFHQAVEEVLESLDLVVSSRPEYRKARILERMVEPERVVMFRVPWLDDRGEIQVNRGYRVQMNSAIGPYKGGLRFHPSVNLGILKFLAFEQVFKNSLTTLPMGGGKGGSDFDPKGKSDDEVMRFCQSFMTRAVAPHRPRHRRARRRHRRRRPRDRLPVRAVQAAAQRVHRRPDRQGPRLGRLADPSRSDGLRRRVLRRRDAEATRNETFEGKTCLVSGSGNVAQYTVEKLLELGAQAGHAVRLGSASSTTRLGSTREAGLDHGLKNVRRGRIAEYADQFKGVDFHAGQRPRDNRCG